MGNGPKEKCKTYRTAFLRYLSANWEEAKTIFEPKVSVYLRLNPDKR
jgi:hypothetical protein